MHISRLTVLDSSESRGQGGNTVPCNECALVFYKKKSC